LQVLPLLLQSLPPHPPHLPVRSHLPFTNPLQPLLPPHPCLVSVPPTFLPIPLPPPNLLPRQFLLSRPCILTPPPHQKSSPSLLEISSPRGIRVDGGRPSSRARRVSFRATTSKTTPCPDLFPRFPDFQPFRPFPLLLRRSSHSKNAGPWWNSTEPGRFSRFQLDPWRNSPPSSGTSSPSPHPSPSRCLIRL